jgi:hypothetical protein
LRNESFFSALQLERDSLGSTTCSCASTYYYYTFGFNAVEFAQSYLIYYSLTDDFSTASSLASGQLPPIKYSYLRADSYGGKTYYFWVRAYDGKNYGKWSTSIAAILN